MGPCISILSSFFSSWKTLAFVKVVIRLQKSVKHLHSEGFPNPSSLRSLCCYHSIEQKPLYLYIYFPHYPENYLNAGMVSYFSLHLRYIDQHLAHEKLSSIEHPLYTRPCTKLFTCYHTEFPQLNELLL